MTIGHMDVISRLAYHLQRQLDIAQFSVYTDARVQIPGAAVFIPDVVVVPDHGTGRALLAQPEVLAILTGPLPLVVEVWSRSTGRYDVDAKLPIYQQRGDAEIWLLHPVERILTAWRRQPDGSYVSMSHRVGAVQPVALPGVSIELAAIFRE